MGLKKKKKKASGKKKNNLIYNTNSWPHSQETFSLSVVSINVQNQHFNLVTFIKSGRIISVTSSN